MSKQVVQDVIRRAARSGDMAAGQLTTVLHRELRMAGWPGHVVSGMRVVHDSGSFSVVCSPGVQDEFHQAEYGTESEPGTNAVHDFCTRMTPALSALHERTATASLRGLL